MDVGPSRRRWWSNRRARVLVRAAVALTVLLAPATPALARIRAEAMTAPDGLTTVNLIVSGSCGGLPTSVVRVQLPAGSSDVRIEPPPGWSVTHIDREVTWAGASIPDAGSATFSFTARVPGRTGDTVFVPAVQRCATVRVESWIEPTDDPDAEGAAPRFVLGATVEPPPPTLPDGSASTTTITATLPPTTAATVDSAESGTATGFSPPGEGPDPKTVAAGLAGGIVVAGLGAWAVSGRTRRRSHNH